MTIQNTGSYPTGYVVTATNGLPNLVTPIPPQACLLGAGQSSTLTFFLASPAPVTGTQNLLVTLTAATGYVFDSVTVFGF